MSVSQIFKKWYVAVSVSCHIRILNLVVGLLILFPRKKKKIKHLVGKRGKAKICLAQNTSRFECLIMRAQNMYWKIMPHNP